MKKLIATVLITFSSLIVLATTTPCTTFPVEKKATNAKSILISIGSTGKTISLFDLAKSSEAELETITGRKMSSWEKFAFKKAKKRLNKGIGADGTIIDRKLQKSFGKVDKEYGRGFSFVGLLLGFVLGLVGVLIAYLIRDSQEFGNVTGWAWIGFGISVVLTVGIYLILFSVYL